jgi:hypothetical protein
MVAPGVPASLRSWMSAVSEIARAVNAAESLDAVLARVAERAQAPEGGYRPPPDAAARRRAPARQALEDMARRYEVVRIPVVTPSGPMLLGASDHGRRETAWVAPVVLGQELGGRLWVTAPPAVPAPVQLRVIERFALVVALELLKARHLVAVEGRLSGDLVADLLRQEGPLHPQSLLDRAAALGHDLTSWGRTHGRPAAARPGSASARDGGHNGRVVPPSRIKEAAVPGMSS